MSTHAGAAQQQATVNSSYVISTWVQNHQTSSLKSHKATKVDALINVSRLFESAFYMGDEKIISGRLVTGRGKGVGEN
jgi:hypothetical protein